MEMDIDESNRGFGMSGGVDAEYECYNEQVKNVESKRVKELEQSENEMTVIRVEKSCCREYHSTPVRSIYNWALID